MDTTPCFEPRSRHLGSIIWVKAQYDLYAQVTGAMWHLVTETCYRAKYRSKCMGNKDEECGHNMRLLHDLTKWVCATYMSP